MNWIKRNSLDQGVSNSDFNSINFPNLNCSARNFQLLAGFTTFFT